MFKVKRELRRKSSVLNSGVKSCTSPRTMPIITFYSFCVNHTKQETPAPPLNSNVSAQLTFTFWLNILCGVNPRTRSINHWRGFQGFKHHLTGSLLTGANLGRPSHFSAWLQSRTYCTLPCTCVFLWARRHFLFKTWPFLCYLATS